MHKTDPIVIIGAARSPMGSFQGSLSNASAPELGGVAISSAINDALYPLNVSVSSLPIRMSFVSDLIASLDNKE